MVAARRLGDSWACSMGELLLLWMIFVRTQKLRKLLVRERLCVASKYCHEFSILVRLIQNELMSLYPSLVQLLFYQQVAT